jgi:hypothetical protein
MDCGGLCSIWEEVETAPYKWPDRGLELWCYCPACNVETFHAIPDRFNFWVQHYTPHPSNVMGVALKKN